jgi:hypothetical protein
MMVWLRPDAFAEHRKAAKTGDFFQSVLQFMP